MEVTESDFVSSNQKNGVNKQIYIIIHLFDSQFDIIPNPLSYKEHGPGFVLCFPGCPVQALFNML